MKLKRVLWEFAADEQHWTVADFKGRMYRQYADTYFKFALNFSLNVITTRISLSCLLIFETDFGEV